MRDFSEVENFLLPLDGVSIIRMYTITVQG